ncbi:MAG: sugar ABC transporter permease YjfF, partial [Spirochaetia bacterium]
FQGTLNSWWTRIVIGFLVFLFCLLQRLFEARKVVRTNESVSRQTVAGAPGR